MFKLSPDSKHVVMLDGTLKANRIEGGFLRQLSLAGVAQNDFMVSPDSQYLIYRATREGATRKFDLFSVPILGGIPVKLSVNLVASNSVVSFRVSPDSKTVAFVVTQNTLNPVIYSVPIDGGSEVKLSTDLDLSSSTSSSARIGEYLFSPDSELLVYSVDITGDQIMELFVVATEGGASRKLHGDLRQLWEGAGLNDEFTVYRLYGFSEDGQDFIFRIRLSPGSVPPIYQSQSSRVYKVRLSTSSPVLIVDSGDGLAPVTFHPNGRHVLVSSGKTIPYNLWKIDLDLQTAPELISLSSIDNTTGFGMVDYKVSNTGRYIALSSALKNTIKFRWGGLYIYDFQTKEIVLALSNENGLFLDFEFTPDDSSLLSYGVDQDIRAYDLRNRSASVLNPKRYKFNSSRRPFRIAISPRSDRLVYPTLSSASLRNFVQINVSNPRQAISLRQSNDLGELSGRDYAFTKEGNHLIYRSDSVVYAVEGWSERRIPNIFGSIYCLLIDDCTPPI